MSIRLLHGDCLIELPKLAAAGERFHAVVCDPPYGLEFMGKEWDGANGFRRSLNEADAGRARGKKKCACAEPDWRVKGAAPDRGHTRRGQMQTYQAWCEAWARAVYDVLLPGAYLFAFGGTRTSHRLVCAIEDAGFEIRDTVAWLYGSGFPKSLDVSKAIDKAAGAQREVIDRVRVKGGGTEHINRSNATVHDYRPDGYQKGENVLDVTAPATDAARQWSGWGTALKPAFEPIVVARKPLDGTVAANVLKHGCGGLNIDASRVEDPMDGVWGTSNATVGRGRMFNSSPDMGEYQSAAHQAGRWPANVVHDGSEEVLAAFPDAPGQQGIVRGTEPSAAGDNGIYGHFGRVASAQPRVTARNEGRQDESQYRMKPTEGTVRDYRDGASAARFFYTAKADRADRADSKHPTVKPVDLIRWLVTLACPPGGHVLDCFAGSGTTGEACMLAGFDCTLIEREAQHARDIEHRIKRWSGLDAPLFAELVP